MGFMHALTNRGKAYTFICKINETDIRSGLYT